MSEIKEFKNASQKPSQPEKTASRIPKNFGKQSLSELLWHPNFPLVSLAVFVILFLLDLYLMVHFTHTGITACCILLVIQTLLAVCLDKLNYAQLLGIAAVELLVGVLSHNFLLSVLCLIPYVMALFVIHVQKLHGGMKSAS